MQLGVRCVRGKVSHDECRSCSMRPLHPCGYPPEVLEAMREENDTYEGTEFTPSKLLECKRRPQLYTSRDHWMNPDNAYSLFRGDAFHKYMEGLSMPPGFVRGVVREKRLTSVVKTKYGEQSVSAKLGLELISGKMDLVVVKRIEDTCIAEGHEERVAVCKIVDYKTKNEIKHEFLEPDRKHVMQLNVYAWLVEQSILDLGLPVFDGVDRVIVDELELDYICMRNMRRFTSAGVTWTRGKEVRKMSSVHQFISAAELCALPEEKLIERVEGIRDQGYTPYTKHGKNYEVLLLEPIHLFPDMQDVEDWVADQIEQLIEARTKLPPRLEGDAAVLCNYCPMYEACYASPE